MRPFLFTAKLMRLYFITIKLMQPSNTKRFPTSGPCYGIGHHVCPQPFVLCALITSDTDVPSCHEAKLTVYFLSPSVLFPSNFPGVIMYNSCVPFIKICSKNEHCLPLMHVTICLCELTAFKLFSLHLLSAYGVFTILL